MPESPQPTTQPQQQSPAQQQAIIDQVHKAVQQHQQQEATAASTSSSLTSTSSTNSAASPSSAEGSAERMANAKVLHSWLHNTFELKQMDDGQYLFAVSPTPQLGAVVGGLFVLIFLLIIVKRALFKLKHRKKKSQIRRIEL